ncbi:MAG: T9SS type A sorting domain-containing protein [Bacteroidota bacterium]
MKNTLLLFFFLFFLGFGAQAQLTASMGNGLSQTKQDDKQQTALKIFPNPASNFIALQGNDEDVYEIRIISLIGKEVLKYQAVKDKKYSIMNLSNGMYLVQMLDIDKKIITTKRLHKR